MGKGRNEKNDCRIVNKQLYFYKSNKQFFLTHFIKFLEWFVCGFENFINQMVKLPRHATEQPTAWPPNENCFFFLFSFFFFILFAISLEAFSNFLHFFLQLVSLFLTSIWLQHPPDLQLLLLLQLQHGYTCMIIFIPF